MKRETPQITAFRSVREICIIILHFINMKRGTYNKLGHSVQYEKICFRHTMINVQFVREKDNSCVRFTLSVLLCVMLCIYLHNVYVNLSPFHSL